MAHTQRIRQYALMTTTRWWKQYKKKTDTLRPDQILPKDKWKIFRGDVVQIIEGRDAGKQGMVLACLYDKARVVVQNCNLRMRQIRGAGPTPGRIIKSEQAIH